jgi:hypothetical protein
MESHTPRLYSYLRLALGALYSLNHHQLQHSLSLHEAHDFLINIQSRNVRRKLESLQQRQLDTNSLHQEQIDDWGSSWLACLAVLLNPDSHPTERLFCAQTLFCRNYVDTTRMMGQVSAFTVE